MKLKHFYRGTSALAGVALIAGLAATPAFAQAVDTAVETIDEGQDDQPVVETDDQIVVTGSRLRRDAFSSASPVQVISGEESAQIGVVDTTQIISESTVVTGPQLDGSVNSGSPTAAVEGVPENGPGSSSVAFRGLGSERTLLLVNGRRLAPSGVRGAPVSPDLNLIPSSLIERVEILTDGASSIYGADAVAGVANIILRNDFEGFEVSAFNTQPFEDGGDTLQVSFLAGAQSDRTRVTVAGEYFNRNAVLAGDRSDWNDCLRDIEIDESTGQVYSICRDGRPDNAVLVLGNSADLDGDGVANESYSGFLFNTPGSSDLGIPNWSRSASFPGGSASLDSTYNLQDEELVTQLLEGFERMNIYTTGEFDLNLFSQDTIYFETSFSRRSSIGRFTSEQVFPGIPATIPVIENGVEVRRTDNPLSPFDGTVLPVVSLDALSQRRVTEIDNFRAVGGITGDIAFGGLDERNWIYDVFLTFEESNGTSTQKAMLENHLREAIDTLRVEDGVLQCGLARTAPGFGFITPPSCPLVNFFSPTLFETQGGNKKFSTQEETDYLFGNVINSTKIEQAHFQAIATGDVVDLPAGSVGLVLGFEFREQRIDSANDIVRAQGLAASEIPDIEGDTKGRTSLTEYFIETEIPVHETFSVNLAGRHTSEENFGEEFTWSAKGDFRPLDWLRFRATYGTSFRAPNLREQFLADSAGTIAGGNDPCLVPQQAIDANGNYDASLDPRDTIVINNCIADGVDPTAFGRTGVTGIPTLTGGADDLVAETADAWTAGFVVSQPFTDAFDLDLSVTYYSIELENTVEESNAAAIIARCYGDEPNLASPFCDRITRKGEAPAQNSIGSVDASFVNVGLQTSKGYDINARFRDDFNFADRSWDFTYNATWTYSEEILEQLAPDQPVDDQVGEAGFPEWAFIGTANLATGNWSALFRSRMIGEFQQDNTDAPGSAGGTDACAISGIATTSCRDVDFGDTYWKHDVSLTYDRDDWSFTAGVQNLFDESPPLVDQGEAPTRLNMVVQSGYDLIGRQFFASVKRRF